MLENWNNKTKDEQISFITKCVKVLTKNNKVDFCLETLASKALLNMNMTLNHALLNDINIKRNNKGLQNISLASLVCSVVIRSLSTVIDNGGF